MPQSVINSASAILASNAPTLAANAASASTTTTSASTSTPVSTSASASASTSASASASTSQSSDEKRSDEKRSDEKYILLSPSQHAHDLEALEKRTLQDLPEVEKGLAENDSR
eukprot:CAMPEP_0174732726 /NCGR_PEP_ID=MMETSP1094-20130205/59931_1 /TAXON_ID=156173 /ORGANISM="Chrysochromulina brevifilum, Strain UTEX LB 985" /LENGTH=112 /DNA_ID=CAMNT_0015935275 /DNA_START=29 /DNA_END=364 /DNA_ORIENTATION=+